MNQLHIKTGHVLFQAEASKNVIQVRLFAQNQSAFQLHPRQKGYTRLPLYDMK